MNIKPISHFLVALTAALTFSAAYAENYPSRAITWVVPYPPGGTTDVVARVIANRMAKDLGVSIAYSGEDDR